MLIVLTLVTAIRVMTEINIFGMITRLPFARYDTADKINE